MKPKLIVSFQRYGEDTFQAKARFIIAKLTANGYFPEPWAPQICSLAKLSEALTAYLTACDESATRDSIKIRVRNSAREFLTELLQQVAPYLEMVAQGNARILETTGYAMRLEPIRIGMAGDLLAEPSDFRVVHGRISGTLQVSMARLNGAASYEVATSQGDGSAGGEWKHATTARFGTRILLSALPPGESFWVRARGVGSSGPGLWTAPVKIMVV